MDRPEDYVFSITQYLEIFNPIVQVLPRSEALRAVYLRMKHVVDDIPQLPQRNTIFEVESDFSEDALVVIVRKLLSKFAQIDVMTANCELRSLVVDQLKVELKATTVEEKKGATKMTGTWGRSKSQLFSNDYSLTVGTLDHFMLAQFEKDVGERKEENRAVVLYRTDAFMEDGGVLEPHPVDTVDLKITRLLYDIYPLVDQLDEQAVVRMLRELIRDRSSHLDESKKSAERYARRFLDARIEAIIRSAKAAKNLIEGMHFGFYHIDGKKYLLTTSSIEKEHFAIRQFLQIHHGLPVTPLQLPTLRRSPLHLLKTYDRVFGVVRRCGYELSQWMPFITELSMYPARVYPTNLTWNPISPAKESTTISKWIVAVDEKMGLVKRIPQGGLRVIVCPSMDALRQLWRYLKYSHDGVVARTIMKVCTGTAGELESMLSGKVFDSLVTVFTTTVHFESWHTRKLSGISMITVFLGTPTNEQHNLRRAIRFARPSTNVVTIPLNLNAPHDQSEGTPTDSGVESKSNDSSESEENERWHKGLRLPRAPSKSTIAWPRQFMKMLEVGDWKTPSCPDDVEYEKFVEPMARKWREEVKNREGRVEWKEFRGGK